MTELEKQNHVGKFNPCIKTGEKTPSQQKKGLSLKPFSGVFYSVQINLPLKDLGKQNVITIESGFKVKCSVNL